MFRFSLLVCLALCGFFGYATAADCVPDPVESIEMLANNTLAWAPSTNCETSYLYYLIYITSSGILQWIWETTNTHLYIDFLPYCGYYNFTVLAVADDDIEGAETQIEASIAPPAGSNITIISFSGASVGHDSLLTWEIDPVFDLCVEFYHVIISDFVNSTAIDAYANSNSYYLENTGACAQYVVNISSVYFDTDGPVASFRYNVSAANLTAPRLVELSKSATSINTTWTLQPYFQNRCNVSSLFVDGSPNFNVTVYVNDTLTRPPVQVNITDLQPSTLYVFRVTANNTAGNSIPVPLAVQTDGY